MGLFGNDRWEYFSALPIEACRQALLAEPQTFGENPFFPERYVCEEGSDTCLRITFNGGKWKRTEYLLRFFPDAKATKMVMEFQHELFGLPPMTSVYEIDKLMQEKIQAFRDASEPYR